MLVLRGHHRIAPSPSVLTIGNFDGVHLGHRALLGALVDAGRKLGLPPAVLTFEPHPREFFDPANAPRRLVTLREKLELLDENGVEVVMVARFNAEFAKLSADAFVEDVLVRGLKAQHIMIGDDFRYGARRAGGFSHLQHMGQRHGFTVEAMHSVLLDGERVSSSGVRAALDVGDMDLAARLLGRPYAFDGRVVHGDKRGRQLGFPTANIRIKHNPLPMTGVFAVEVRRQDRRTGLPATPGDEAPVLFGVANLGVRPTVEGTRPLLEIHIFDFAGNLYGAHLNVRFRKKIREEMKFPGLDALTAQIAQDALAARAFFNI
jgi:riboflavin kinase / FMN adenylyltransferase